MDATEAIRILEGIRKEDEIVYRQAVQGRLRLTTLKYAERLAALDKAITALVRMKE